MKDCLRLLTLIAVWVSSLSVFANPHITIAPAPDWLLPVKPGGRIPSPKEFTEGYYNALVDLQTHVERQQVYTHIIRDIRTTEGVQNGSQISVYINPAYEQLMFHTITVHRGNQSIQKLVAKAFKLAPVEAEHDRFIYNGTYAATVLLDDVRPGDRIEYAYTLTGFNPVFGRRFTCDYYFSSQDLLPHRHQVLIMGADRKLTLREFNKPPSANISERNGLKVYEWDAYNLKSPLKEPHEPDWNNREGHIQISEYDSWREVVDWALPMYTVQKPSGPLLPIIADWKRQAATNQLKYLQLAVTFVQNDVRYMGIEIGENSHRPHNPEQVLRQRYGDCKDKSLLLCSLLKANQIEAYPALTSTYDGTQTNMLLPSPLAFNHAVVYIRLGNKTYWIDPTLSHQRSIDGEFSMPHYGTALVLCPGEKGLTPVTSPRRGTIDITETYVVPSPRLPKAIGKLHVTSTYSFNHADNMRGELAGSSLAALEKSYLNFYQSNYNEWGVDLLDSLRIVDDSESNTITSYEAYSITNGWQIDSASGLAIFDVVGRTLYDNLLQLTAQKRRQPIALPFPYEMDYKIKLKLPETWTANDDKWSVQRGAYELKFDRFYNTSDSTISLLFHYKTLSSYLPPESVGEYRADVKKITNALQYQLTYNRDIASKEGQKHPGSIIFFLLAIIGFSYLSWRWYQYSPPKPSDSDVPLPIGGWLILIAISFLFTPFVVLKELLSSSVYTDAGTWALLKNATSSKEALLQLCIYFEGLTNLFLFCFLALCVVLFVQRRNTFALFYSMYLGGRVAFLVADATVVGLFTDNQIGAESYKTIFQAILGACIWVPYLNKSSRVRRTFVRPYAEQVAIADQVEHTTATTIESGVTTNDTNLE